MTKNNELTKELKTVLANSYALFLKTQNYHWNVTGPNFKALHELFELEYNDLFTAIDEIAERIRTIGEKVEANFAYYNEISEIKAADHNKNASGMVQELVDDQNLIIKSLKKALKEAENAGDEVSADLIIGRVNIHEKNGWMLRSSL